ncbi:MAG TPA: amino acid ABC transporter substrate-binding protein [Chromatiales bacterium]|nr:amino acid ABC transporter substrate-binding protein [Thiotrichales bacterium]HIP69528.1 amino acid ABC transporter substrate-binding protein [Chromatiales bacterium]
MRAIFTFILLACILLSPVQAVEKTFVIGYLELESDPRYKERYSEARYRGQPWGRPFDGAKIALKEVRFAAASAGVKFELKRKIVKDDAELIAALDTLISDGAEHVLVDAPAASINALAKHAAGKAVLLFNVSAVDNSLRQKQCRKNLLHIIPSRAMLMDALAQYLVSSKWRKVLVLQGPRPGDADIYQAFKRSAKRFGLKIVDTKPFKLGRDPRQRSRNNVALLTSGKDYDVVFVADSDGEFARAVPYQIQRPRPVVGSAGLVAEGWHWAWDRHGAPQLSRRFLRKSKRWMTAYDWSAWMAVKALAEAVQRTGSTELNVLKQYLLSEKIVLDGFKGYPLSFRSWNNQLRQPVFLTTGNWVVARAPLEGFLHDKNNLDTLGFDAREIKCQ